MHTDFDEFFIESMAKLLSQNDATKIKILPQFHGFWLVGENEETELRILRLADFQIIVSRVCITHKRNGCMSEIFRQLIEYARNNHIPRILVQCVNTAEMAAWCEHRGLIHDDRQTYHRLVDGYKTGDYIWSIDQPV